MRAPLARVTRQLRAPGQARRRQGLTPRSPRRQAVTGRSQLPQTRRSQTKQPSSTGLLHGHHPKPLSAGHQRRIVPAVTSEQALAINTAGTVSIRALTATTVTIAATVAVAVVVVLGSDQQAGQQPLHHTGQCSASGQGPQQARHALSAGHRPWRHVLARRARRPDRITGRDTRKHTTFEHMYSIARPSTTRTPG